MNYKRIPEEIQALDQWVCAYNTSKTPMRSTAREAASSTDPSTWGTFEQAVLSVADGNYDHIGFVFADNGIVGIDIDKGFEDGLMTPLCADIMSVCRSYTEVSRSGRGVHILLKGTLPFSGRNNRNGVEIYRTGRFFITTGDVCLFPQMIENQDAIDYVVQKYFPEVRVEKSRVITPRFYRPGWRKPEPGKVPVSPEYVPVGPGARNQSLTSLAGSMWTLGYSKAQIYKELLKANQKACRPPLPRTEVESICRSITRYRR